ncbi:MULTISPECIES: FAD-binding oxidoreductase [unclassified Meiothermus]|uniref:FAD-binding oxidoreductase n=1 Tax=unclassified Meiothermus TaxID=370471 RepID=UPI000D7CBD8B|nr:MULTISPECIES: FAD-binding oxidoreductase [unclassified Meiothermus]PZA07696.1 FAD-binding oxidoreductase [Meiothermus sp. Pnk-1]RYM34492.1 FAD-binding oxidoreductase [Meiothermus sp. PNK-Is4]
MSFSGAVFRKGEPGYEEARVGRIFNGRRPERYPELIVFAEDEEDVVRAVRLARSQGLRLAIRAGGHSWAAWSLWEGALLLDLSRMQEMAYDEATGVVRVAPAVKGGATLAPYLEARGRMFHGGHCPTVGLGGFLLQGGMGWNCRGWGWAAEAVMALEVVTAEGERVWADAERNPDLYWAARGAGPGFPGVVTRFYLQTRPLPKALTQTTHIYPLDYTAEVLAWLQEIHAQVDPRVELVALSLVPPGLGHRALVVHGLAMVDSPEEGRAALALLETCPVREKALVRQVAEPTSFEDERREQLRQNPEGARYAVDNAWVAGPPEAVVPRLVETFTTPPTPETFALWFSMAPLRPLPDMALSLQSEIYFALYTIWRDPTDDVRCREWLAQQMGRLEPVTLGQYLGDSDFTTRALRFMQEAHWARLQAIRAQRDPAGLFVSYLIQDERTLNKNPWECHV